MIRLIRRGALPTYLFCALGLMACSDSGSVFDADDEMTDEEFDQAASMLEEGKSDSDGLDDDTKKARLKVLKRLDRLMDDGRYDPPVSRPDEELSAGTKMPGALDPPVGYRIYRVNVDRGDKIIFRVETPDVKTFMPVVVVRTTDDLVDEDGDEVESNKTWSRIRSTRENDGWDGDNDARVLSMGWRAPWTGTYEVIVTTRKNLQTVKARTDGDFVIGACLVEDNYVSCKYKKPGDSNGSENGDGGTTPSPTPDADAGVYPGAADAAVPADASMPMDSAVDAGAPSDPASPLLPYLDAGIAAPTDPQP